MRKGIAALMTAVYVLWLGLYVYADGPVLQVSAGSGIIGETVDVTVSISNNPGISPVVSYRLFNGKSTLKFRISAKTGKDFQISQVKVPQ